MFAKAWFFIFIPGKRTKTYKMAFGINKHMLKKFKEH